MQFMYIVDFSIHILNECSTYILTLRISCFYVNSMWLRY